jgi:hypothetical protein
MTSPQRSSLYDDLDTLAREDTITKVYAVFCSGRLIQVIKTNVLMVLFVPGLCGTSLIYCPTTVDGVHARCLAARLSFTGSKKLDIFLSRRPAAPC